jgi:hypothetical protein
VAAQSVIYTAANRSHPAGTGIAVYTDMAQVTVAAWEPFGDGGNSTQHLLDSVFGSGPAGLAAAQAVFPWVDDLTPEYDYCAIQQAIDYAYLNNLCSVFLPQGRYFTTAPIFVDHPNSLRAQGDWPRWSSTASNYTSISFTGSVSGTTLTVTSISSNVLHANMWFGGPNLAFNNKIVSQASGTPGGVGTYTITPSQGAIGPETMTASDLVIYNGVPFIALRTVPVGAAPYLQHAPLTSPFLEVAPDPNWEYWYYTPANSNKRASLNQVNGVQFTFMGTPNSTNSVSFGSCINPNFSNAQGIVMGPNNGGSLEDITVYIRLYADPVSLDASSGTAIKGGINPGSTGVCVSGTGAGSSRTIIRRVAAYNAYTAFQVGTPGGGLGDSNDFYHCTDGNCFISFSVNESQAFINSFYACNFTGRIGLLCRTQQTLTVYGGNYSTEGEAAEATVFPLTAGGTSALTNTDGSSDLYTFGQAFINFGGGVRKLTFTATINPATVSTPDMANLTTHKYTDGRNGIYTVFTMLTAHFGLVPLLCTGYNPTTHVISLMVYPPWSGFAVNGSTYLTDTDFQAEIQACTSLYAATMVFPFQAAINGFNPFVETIIASVCLFSNSIGPTSINGLTLDYEMNLSSIAPGHSPTPQQLSHYYAQHAFPTFHCAGYDVEIRNLISGTAQFYDSFISDSVSGGRLIFDNAPMYPNNLRSHTGVYGLAMDAPSLNNGVFGGAASKLTVYDRPSIGGVGAKGSDWLIGRGAFPQAGVRPAQYVIPSIFDYDVTTLANTGSLPAVAPNACPYPLVYGGTIYQTQAVGFSAGQLLFESNHSGFSYHQALTTSNISGLSWSAKGQSNCVYIDANTMQLMFYGLVIGLTTDAQCFYMVMGIYPQLGYITVFNLTTNSARISGVKTTVYTGTSISSQPYRIRAVNTPSIYTNVTNTVATVGSNLQVDTSAAAKTIKAPAGLVNGSAPYVFGDQWTIDDYAGTFGANNLTIAPNGGLLNGGAGNIIVSTNNEQVRATWVGGTTGWKVTGVTPTVLTPTSSGLLLDSLSSPAQAAVTAAYSTRKLRGAYSGSPIRVGHISTLVEQDIGFAGNDLDTAALNSFITAQGGGSACVTVWYDQSGHGHNASMGALAASNEKIVNAGTINTLNGHASIVLDGASNNVLSVTLTSGSAFTLAAAIKTGTIGDEEIISDSTGVALSISSTKWQIYAGTGVNSTVSPASTTAYGVIGAYNGASSTMNVSGTTVASGNPGSNTFTNLVFGAGFGFPFNGHIPEAIVFNIALSGADQSVINGSWTTYWGT